jgi:hypothetical protein
MSNVEKSELNGCLAQETSPNRDDLEEELKKISLKGSNDLLFKAAYMHSRGLMLDKMGDILDELKTHQLLMIAYMSQLKDREKQENESFDDTTH